MPRTQENTWRMKGSFIYMKLLQLTLEALNFSGFANEATTSIYSLPMEVCKTFKGSLQIKRVLEFSMYKYIKEVSRRL